VKQTIILSIGIFFCSLVFVQAQDLYHSDLINRLQNDFGLTSAEFVLFDTEEEINVSSYIYGNSEREYRTGSELSFDQYADIMVLSAGANPWDSGMGFNNQKVIAGGEVVLLHFFMKRTSDSGSVNIFVEDAATFDKEFFNTIDITPDWTEYFIAFKSTKTYQTGELAMGFHLANEQQHIQIGGYTALNYGAINLEDVPSSFSPANYGGFEADAAWRTKAAQRIEELRMVDIEIKVFDANGQPLKNTELSIEMTEHEFGFGSAFAMSRFPGNRAFNQTYLDKLTNLDGLGHGFNVGVNENALKWDAWEEEWIGTPQETRSAFQWLAGKNIEMRGHVLVWPGFSNMPDDIEQNRNSIDYIKGRISNRLSSMLEDRTLNALIQDWDILNEITTNRDLENSFKSAVGYETGRELYQEILSEANAIAPEKSYFVNDFITLSGGGSSVAVIDRYKSYLDEMANSENPFDGIGFQCHIGSIPTSILKIQETLDDFYERYQVPFKITEYDIEPSVDETTQAKYMDDFLTMVFSHPAVESFIMWGFWDGNHWKENAPMFNLDWSLKPSGQVFIDKVFSEWWTTETGMTDEDGIYRTRVFKGDYQIDAIQGTTATQVDFSITEDMSVEVFTDFTSTTLDPILQQIQVYPNPSINGVFQIHLPSNLTEVSVEIFDTTGGKINNVNNFSQNGTIQIADNGIYQLRFRSGNRVGIQSVVVSK